MKVEELGEEDGVLRLKLEDATDAEANTLRRVMMSKVPTLAIKELEVTKNDSGLFDEVLANRVGQVPFTLPENLEEDDEISIAVKKEGPVDVKAGDLQAGDEEVEPVNPGIILVTLKEDQELEFEATAVAGYGEEHAKHQGGTVGYEKTGEGEYKFRIESTSGYSNRELFNTAVDIILDELDEFEEEVEDL
ncbi:MAG: hypothetical protein ABEK10_01120 [Candidatus Nanosalina sp.]